MISRKKAQEVQKEKQQLFFFVLLVLFCGKHRF